MPLISTRLRSDATLLCQMTKSNFKLQNENSILGVVWYLLGPMLLFGIMLFVFSNRLGQNVEHYPLYLLMGIITWNFFATGAGRSMTAITSNAVLVKSLPIRLEVLIVASVLHALISHSIEIGIFIAMLLWFGILPTLLLLYLFVLLLSFIFTIGVGLLLASVFVIFRDLQQIWSVVTRAWWFATPIFYVPTATGPGAKLSLFNPLYYSIHLSRELLIYQHIPPIHFFVIYAVFAVSALVVGHCMFHALRSYFVPLL